MEQLTKGPKDFANSTQAQHWTFDSIETVNAIHSHVHEILVDKFAELGSNSSEVDPRCLTRKNIKSLIQQQRKRPRDESSTPSNLPTVHGELSKILTFPTFHPPQTKSVML
jgi:hypothetical protein